MKQTLTVVAHIFAEHAHLIMFSALGVVLVVAIVNFARKAFISLAHVSQRGDLD
jgi:hypothetical protein